MKSLVIFKHFFLAFVCLNTSDIEEGTKGNEKDSPKITLKIVRSPKKGSKRKTRESLDKSEGKLKKKFKKEAHDEEYVPSDSGSNGDKGTEVTNVKQKKLVLFKGAKTEKAS